MTIGSDGLFSGMILNPSNAWCLGSYLPGPQFLNSAFVASSSAGESATIAPTFRSVFAHPSRRFPIPGAKESSTYEWHSAHVTPTFVSWPAASTVPFTPTTALRRNNSIVTAGLVRSTWPARRAATTPAGSASTSTFRPTASAATGSTVGMTSCIRRTSVHSCSSPNVS